MTRARLALVALAATAACSPVDERAVRAGLVGGTLDGADPAVVALTARRSRCEDNAPMLLCTGTLIAPRVVLTAAHCLQVFGADGQYEVVFGSSASDPSATRSVVARAQAHPRFDPTTHENDLALLLLAAPVAVTPVALPVSTLSTSAIGLQARAVGFGETKNAAEAAGLKRSGTLSISSVTATAFLATPSPSMTCTGDSGGPVFVTLDAQEQLMGVTASGDPGCAADAKNVRVDAALNELIDPFAVAASSEPVLGPGGALPLDKLCADTCNTSAECPAALACVHDEHGTGRCMSLSLREGDYLASCASDAQCGAGESCARVWPDGDAACRCFRPCAPPFFGCAVATGFSNLSPWLLIGALALRTRSRRSKGWGQKHGQVHSRQVAEVSDSAG